MYFLSCNTREVSYDRPLGSENASEEESQSKRAEVSSVRSRAFAGSF